VGLAVIIVLTLAACSNDSGADSTASGSTTTGAPTATSSPVPADTTTTTPALVGVSTDFSRAVIELGGIPYTVAVADTNEERVRGLMGVEELSPLDGMLFVFDRDAVRSFWMKDTLMPLDIAFFDDNGFLVGQTSMSTCLDGDCPRYSSEGLARYALEAPLGSFEGLPTDTRLVIIGAIDGSGKEI